MSARTMQIIANLAERRALDSLSRLCDDQKQVSTGRLYAYVTQAGDTLSDYAFELRREHDALARRCRELQELLDEHRRCNQAASAWTDAEELRGERDTLRAEVERLRQTSARYEHVRRLNHNQFGKLWKRNIMTGIPFDQLVDEDMGTKP